MPSLILCTFLSSFLFATNQNPTVTTVPFSKTYTTKNYKHMYFGGIPTESDLISAKEKGLIEVVIDVRGANEVPPEDRVKIESLGLEYYHVPLMSEGKLDPRSVQKLEELHKKTHKQGQLIHCASGNRVSAWFATHLIKKDKWEKEKALALARQLGLTKKDLEAAVIEYVNSY